jgi:hypothetical protein
LASGSVAAQFGNPVQATTQQGGIAELLDVTQFTTQTLDLPAEPGEGFAVWMNLDGENRVVLLHPYSVRADNYQLYTDAGNGPVPVASDAPATYRGHVVGVADSGAAASLIDGQLRAIIRMEDGSYRFVQPFSELIPGTDPAQHVVYAAADSVAQPDWVCGNSFLELKAPQSDTAGEPGDDLRTPGNDLAEIAFDADYEFYLENGSSVPATENDIETILNNVDFMYDRDVQINYTLTAIIVRTNSNDPYTATDAGQRLDQFRAEWQANQGGINRDVAHLMTGVNLNGGVIGVAWLGSICSSSFGYGLSESNFSININFRTALTAHELGHNWDAIHCDGDPDCFTMCSGLNGCAGVGDPNFGSRSISDIRSFAQFANCLDEVIGDAGIDHQFVEVPITAQAIADDGTLEQALTYDLQVVITNDDDWTSSDTTAAVDGLLYQHPSFDSNVPQTALWGTFPSTEFDSFFSAANFEVPGFADGPFIDASSMSAIYFDTNNTGNGTYTIGRFTVLGGTNLSIGGASTAASTQGQLHYFDFDIPISIPTLTHQVVEVPITQDAIDEDPTLAGAKTFDLQVETTGGDDWTSTDATASIDGTIYQHPNFDSDVSQATLWGTFPSVEFDSFFTAPTFEVPGFADGPNITNNSMSAIWFDTANTGEGVFTIARYTVTAGTTLSISGTSTAANTDGDLIPFDFSVNVDLDPPCPGDLNGDGLRDQSDLGLLLASYLQDDGGDIDGDGDTDQADLGQFLSVYNVPCP